jgi:hypothetical protein
VGDRTNGWRPGMPSTLALRAGPFHALLTRPVSSVIAWVGAERCPMSWPDGVSIRLDPHEDRPATVSAVGLLDNQPGGGC